MDIPFEYKLINTIYSWQKKGFNNFKLFDDGKLFGITFYSKEEKGRILCKGRNRKENIKTINRILKTI